jgi:hypothetical protein
MPHCSECERLFKAFRAAAERWRLLTKGRAPLESTTGLTLAEMHALAARVAAERDAALNALVEHFENRGCGQIHVPNMRMRRPG